MAKMKNEDLNNLVLALNELLLMKLPPRTGMKLRSLHRLVVTQNEDLNAERTKFVEEFCLRDESGEPVKGEPLNGSPTVKLKEGEMDAFNKAIEDLYNAEFEVPVTFSIEEFGDAPIEPLVLVRLGSLIED
jgi:hypothetical protein